MDKKHWLCVFTLLVLMLGVAIHWYVLVNGLLPLDNGIQKAFLIGLCLTSMVAKLVMMGFICYYVISEIFQEGN